jgi:predicted RNase H-like nuclease (RuvC/YqgF family)
VSEGYSPLEAIDRPRGRAVIFAGFAFLGMAFIAVTIWGWKQRKDSAARYAELSSKNACLVGEKSHMAEEITRLTAEKDSLKGDNDSLKKDISQLRPEVSRLSTDNARLATDLANAVVGCVWMVAGLSSELQSKSQACHDLSAKLDKVKVLAASLESMCENYAYSVGQAKVAIPDLLIVVDTLKLKIADMARAQSRDKKIIAALSGLQDLIEKLRIIISGLVKPEVATLAR